MAALASLPPPTTTSIVFPPPPPTTNTLTPVQRAQLRKSTKKLGQILGATPQLLDTDIVGILGPVHIQLPPRSETLSPILSRSSVDSFSSTSSSDCSFYPNHPYATCTASSERTTPATSPTLQTSFRTNSSSAHPEAPDSPTSKTPPILRLAVVTPTTRSPSPTPSLTSRVSLRSSPTKFHFRSNSFDDLGPKNNALNDMRFTLQPARHSTPVQSHRDSMCDSALRMVSPSAARRQKMNRLRKMLGDDVPMHLVFPDQREDDGVAEVEGGYEMVSADECPLVPLAPIPVAGTVVPRPKKAGVGKIMGARDSLSIVSPHRAKRQEKEQHQRDNVTSSTLPPPPSPPIVIPASAISKDQSQKLLGIIVESPEEHGSSPFEGYGFGGTSVKKPTSFVGSAWRVTSDTVESGLGLKDAGRLWNTRKGYGGWERPRSAQEKKKPMSYRKPPPPLDL